MHEFLWLAIAWIGGTMLILGSLMTIGSMMLLLLPLQFAEHQQGASFHKTQIWRQRLILISVSVLLAAGGLSLLAWVPFPGAVP